MECHSVSGRIVAAGKGRVGGNCYCAHLYAGWEKCLQAQDRDCEATLCCFRVLETCRF